MVDDWHEDESLVISPSVLHQDLSIVSADFDICLSDLIVVVFYPPFVGEVHLMMR